MSNENEYTQEEVEKWIEEVGTKLWDIDTAIEQGIKTDKKIFFHPGIAKGALEHKKELGFIYDETLKSNVAYTLMVLDVYDWFLKRFGIEFLLRQLIIKNAITLYGNIIDAIVRYVSKILNDNDSECGTKSCLSILVDHGIIEQQLKMGFLENVWAIRNKQHLISLSERELDKYTDDDYELAIKIWNEFKEKLTEAKDNGKF